MHILVINAGSSSLKAELWDSSSAQALLRWHAQRIGGAHGAIVSQSGSAPTRRQVRILSSHADAFQALLRELGGQPAFQRVGHRVVHGGPDYVRSTWLDDHVCAELRRLVPLSPLHQPLNLQLIDASRQAWPAIPQAAVFDTEFHATLPPVAREYALPQTWRAWGVRRYGFHGIACEDVLHQLGAARASRLVICHLGSGASVTAVLDGASVDTSMGMTPLGGLVMATRSGDVDPGALLYLLRERGVSPAALDRSLNEASGLLGLAGDRDMAHLLAADTPTARFAVELFCYRVRKAIGAHAAALGGLDQLVFSGGIGENAPAVRAAICAPLDFLGVRLDPAANAANEARLAAGPVDVRRIAVNENRAIARTVAALPAPPAVAI
ncbi:MAG: acetate/propionate family kinase [Pseudomonadota bacterium]